MSRKNDPNPLKEELMQRMLDTYDLMELFKVKRGTINNWCNKGELTFTKVGSKRFFDAYAIKAKLEEHWQKQVPGVKRKKNM